MVNLHHITNRYPCTLVLLDKCKYNKGHGEWHIHRVLYSFVREWTRTHFNGARMRAAGGIKFKSRDFSRLMVYFFCRILRMLFSDRWYLRLSVVTLSPAA